MASRSRVRCCGGSYEVETKFLTREHPECRKCSGATRGRRRSAALGYAEVIPDQRLRLLWLHRFTSIISRCYDPRHAAYPRYGGRGIRIYRGWRHNRLAFLRYAVTLPQWDNPALDLDRVDNDRGYLPGNLRLCSRGENCRNKRRTRRVEINGERLPYQAFWAAYVPLWSPGAAWWHLSRGRSPEWVVDRYQRTRGSVGSAGLRAP